MVESFARGQSRQHPLNIHIPWAGDLEIRVLTGTDRAVQSHAKLGHVRHVYHQLLKESDRSEIRLWVTVRPIWEDQANLGRESRPWTAGRLLLAVPRMIAYSLSACFLNIHRRAIRYLLCKSCDSLLAISVCDGPPTGTPAGGAH